MTTHYLTVRTHPSTISGIGGLSEIFEHPTLSINLSTGIVQGKKDPSPTLLDLIPPKHFYLLCNGLSDERKGRPLINTEPLPRVRCTGSPSQSSHPTWPKWEWPAGNERTLKDTELDRSKETRSLYWNDHKGENTQRSCPFLGRVSLPYPSRFSRMWCREHPTTSLSWLPCSSCL